MTDTTETLAWKLMSKRGYTSARNLRCPYLDAEAEFKTVIQGLYDPHDSTTYSKETRDCLIKLGMSAAGRIINSRKKYAIVGERIGIRDIGSIDFETALSALVAARVGFPMTREELLTLE